MRQVTVAIVLTLLLSPAAWAATPTEALRQVFAQADRILTDPKTEDRPLERLLAVRKVINDALEFREATALAFGRHWGTATPTDQQEFTNLLGDMLERSYISRLASSQASVGGGAQIRYLGESIEGDEAFVSTAVPRRNGGEILLGYRMIERDGRWKVRDVIVDGVSVAANYRAQIERVLEVASIPELLVQMREKVGRVAPPGETVAAAEPVPSTDTTVVSDTLTPVLTAAVEEASPPALVAEPIPSAPARPAPPTEKRDILVTAAPPRPVTGVTKAYWLRLGTVKAMEESGRLATLLDERKLVVAVEFAASAGKARTLTVRVGPFQDATDAVLKLLELQTKGYDPSLVAERE